jgi:hypothetical protein
MKYTTRRAILVTGMMAAFLLVVPPRFSGAARKPPLFEKVVLVPIVVEAVPFEQTPPRPDEAEIVRKLADEATKQAERILARAHVAGEVVRVASTTATPSAPDETTASVMPTVSGTLRLPVSLPPKVRGWNASQRKGRFATVSLTITDPRTGVVLAHSEGTCDWKDAFWTRGARSRRNAPLDDVLAHFARKTTERAVWQAYDSADPKRKEQAK